MTLNFQDILSNLVVPSRKNQPGLLTNTRVLYITIQKIMKAITAWTPKVCKTHGPKPLELAQRAFLVHTLGVQVLARSHARKAPGGFRGLKGARNWCFSAISAAKWVSAKPWKLILFCSMTCVSWDGRLSKCGSYQALLRQRVVNEELGCLLENSNEIRFLCGTAPPKHAGNMTC